MASRRHWTGWRVVALLGVASGCAATVGSTQGGSSDGGADAGPPPIVDLAAAGPNTCALRSDGRVRCWGQYGRGGDATAPPPGTIAEVAGLTDAVRIAVQPDGPAQGCAVRASGEVSCWSTNAPGAVGRPRAVARPLPARARDVVMGSAHACVLTVDRAVLCWGDIQGGLLGAGDFQPHEGAVPVVGLPPVEEVSAWESNTCARTADGAVYCWGRNFRGALGDGVGSHGCPDPGLDADCSAVPVRVLGIGAAQSVSVGLNTGCALVEGAPHCWGWSTSRGGSDGGLTKSATRVGELADVTSVFAGYVTGAAIRRGGEVVLWGADFSMESDGGNVSDGRPRPVAGIRRARRVTGGWYHLCALQEDGAVYCWGTGGFGQLARPGTERSGPVRIEGL